MKHVMELLKSEDGVTSIEYALLGSLIFLVIIGGVTLFGQRLNALFDHIAAELAGAIGG
jgi:pilus assembly protein Flp/PilA